MPLDNDIPRSRLTSLIERERERRLQESSPSLCREILDGALERIYSDDGTHIAYRDMRGNLFDLSLNPIGRGGMMAMTSTGKHTPGRMVVRYGGASVALYQIGAGARGSNLAARDRIIVLTREPSLREADPNVKLLLAMAAATDLLAALMRLTTAAANRENTMGDPMRLLEVQAELREAATEARAVIAKATGGAHEPA